MSRLTPRELFLAFAVMIAAGLGVLTTGHRDLFKAPLLPNASFHGYACYDDCADHRSAYAWARREGIRDPAQCRHISRAFREGCTAWTRDGAKPAS